MHVETKLNQLKYILPPGSFKPHARNVMLSTFYSKLTLATDDNPSNAICNDYARNQGSFLPYLMLFSGRKSCSRSLASPISPRQILSCSPRNIYEATLSTATTRSASSSPRSSASTTLTDYGKAFREITGHFSADYFPSSYLF